MTLVFGGTTEGRTVVQELESLGKTFFYSTLSDLQEVEMQHGVRVVGDMDARKIADFCTYNHVSLIIDASHPFAVNLHRNIALAAKETGIRVEKREREASETVEGAVYCNDFSDAVTQLEQHDITHLLALSGANTIRPLRDYWQKHRTTFRILDRDEGRMQAFAEGLTPDDLIYFPLKGQPSLEEEIDMMRRIGCDAMITKDSGKAGGMATKVKAAQTLGMKVFIVRRPDERITPCGNKTND